MNKYVKIGISLVTIGVTATVAYQVYKKYKLKKIVDASLGGGETPRNPDGTIDTTKIIDVGSLSEEDKKAIHDAGGIIAGEGKGVTTNTSTPSILNGIMNVVTGAGSGKGGNRNDRPVGISDKPACSTPDFPNGSVYVLYRKKPLGKDSYTKYSVIYDGCKKYVKGYRATGFADLTKEETRMFNILGSTPSPLI